MPKEAKAKAPKEKKAKGKKEKDPNAPKRPLSAYMLFSKDARESVKEENPGATFGELGKLLGKKWSEMSDDEKAPYNKQHQEAKAKYDEDVKDYQAKKESATEEKEDKAASDKDEDDE